MIRFELIIMILLIFSKGIFGQEIPTKNEILRCVYGDYDENTQGYTKKIKAYNCENPTFKVSFAEYAIIENQKILIVKCDADCFSQHGHQFGLTDYFLISNIDNQLQVLTKIEISDTYPIGDDLSARIVKIGKDINAMITTFISTGNNHLERSISINLITLTNIKNIGYIDLDYSNEPFYDFSNTPKDEYCKANSVESEYIIESNDNEYFDIVVNKKSTSYTNGCIEKIVKEDTIVYKFNGQKYVN